jgi:hypothetical protein
MFEDHHSYPPPPALPAPPNKGGGKQVLKQRSVRIKKESYLPRDKTRVTEHLPTKVVTGFVVSKYDH